MTEKTTLQDDLAKAIEQAKLRHKDKKMTSHDAPKTSTPHAIKPNARGGAPFAPPQRRGGVGSARGV